jgi:hypothetical protein
MISTKVFLLAMLVLICFKNDLCCVERISMAPLSNKNNIAFETGEYVELVEITSDDVFYKSFIPQSWAADLSPSLFFSDINSMKEDDFCVVAKRMGFPHVFGWIKFCKSSSGFFEIYSMSCNDAYISQELIASIFFVNFYYFGQNDGPILKIPYNLNNKNLLSRFDAPEIGVRELVYDWELKNEEWIKVKKLIIILDKKFHPVARFRNKLEQFNKLIRLYMPNLMNEACALSLDEYIEQLRMEFFRILAILQLQDPCFGSYEPATRNCAGSNLMHENAPETFGSVMLNFPPKIFTPKILINE